ncbi:MAG: DUF4339 domain-containing protein [Kiritimatiellia bacterium]
MIWYCISNGTQRGPISSDELQTLIRDGLLKSDDYVWNESFGNQWRQVCAVPELALPPVMPAPGQACNTPLAGVPGSHPLFRLAMQQAWDHMLNLLFRRASFARWMGLSFCVWITIVGLYEPNLCLEFLANQAAPDPALIATLQTSNTPDTLLANYQAILGQMADRIHEELTPALVQTAATLWLILAAITSWLRARGTFMVMHGWYHPDASLPQFWAAGKHCTQALFLFRLGYNLLFGALIALIGVSLYTSVFVPLSDGDSFEGGLAIRGFLLVLGLSLLLTVWLTVAVLTTHFAVPIMFWRRTGILAAWHTVLEFCYERPAALTIYFTMYAVLLHVVLAALILGMCCTCCCLSYLLMLPFINGLLYLPATIFFRGLSIAFLRQWRPDLETGGTP